MRFPSMRQGAAGLALAAGLSAAQVKAPPAAAEAPPVLSSAAERVYDMARPRILQIRTLLQAAGRQSSIGSGFVMSVDGLAITNYHVVSQFALDPRTYRLEYLAPDGARGALQLLAIDVSNDLAVVKLDRTGLPAFEFDPRALAGRLPKGERIYAMGNPLDLGFTIVEGTYNGLVDRTYDERIHFSGAINPGMSGGPVTGADGRSYKVDTYVTWKQITNSGSTTGRLVKLVSIVVRGNASPYPVYARVSSAFDESTGQ